MKKWVILAMVGIFMLTWFTSLPACPASATTDSWIKIVEPSPGIYWHGDKVFSIKNAVVMIGMGNEINVEATGSDNIISVYFSLYDAREKNMTTSQWDLNKNDGWGCTLYAERGIYVLVAAGAAIDINEPVAVDYTLLVVW